jgi:hypothetical protein
MKKLQKKLNPTRLEPFEKYVKLNSVILNCPRKKDKKTEEEEETINSDLNNLALKPTKPNLYKHSLNNLAEYYMKLSERISETIITQKFQKIYKDIYHFCLTMEYYNDPFYQALILNTDQNADTFFENMEKYFEGKFELIFKYDHHFSDMKTLIKDLKLNKDVDYENMDNVNVRLIVLRDIQKIDATVLNIFLNKIIEIHQDVLGPFKNILVFDVGYDPRSLFDKIKPNLLTKMIFNNVDNIASKDIYKEILYQYVYESNSLFIPNTVNLKKIVDFVNNHQISIYSFKHYFKFLIIDFFLLQEWQNEEFLIFANDKEERNINEECKIIKKKYNSLQKESMKNLNLAENHLLEIFFRRRLTRDYFFKIYKILENLADKSSKIQKTEFNKFQFFFEFLQFGSETDKLVIKRRELIKKYILADNIDCIKLIEDLIPQLKELCQERNELTDTLIIEINKLEQRLAASEKNNTTMFKESSSSRVNKICFNGGGGGTLPSGLRNQDVQNIISDWLLSFLKLDCFSEIFSYDKLRSTNSQISKFINFSEITNPALPALVINDLTGLKNNVVKPTKKTSKNKILVDEEEGEGADGNNNCETITKQNIKNKINKFDLLEQFLIVFGSLGSEFKLKYLYADYLQQFIDLEDIETSKKYIDTIKNFFLKMCHEFYILGLISRKKAKSDIFSKNYFQISNYYNEN